MTRLASLCVFVAVLTLSVGADDRLSRPALFAVAPHDELSTELLYTADALGVQGRTELFDVNETEPVRVLKIEDMDETFLLFHVMSTGENVFASIKGAGDEAEMRVWGAGPDEAVFSASGIRIRPRIETGQANLGTLVPATDGVVENLLCLGRSLGIDFTNLSGSGLTNLISRASCSGSNSLALVLTAASCLSVPHPMAIAGCVTGMVQLISCGYINCASCSVSNISKGNTVSGTFAAGCRSTHRNGSYAQFYKFTLSQATTVTIDLTSTTVDTYLFLLQGNGTGGQIVSSDDDNGAGVNARIVRSLSAGTYTIEATTYQQARSGAFSLSLR
jgi:hypothetical protein